MDKYIHRILNNWMKYDKHNKDENNYPNKKWNNKDFISEILK